MKFKKKNLNKILNKYFESIFNIFNNYLGFILYNFLLINSINKDIENYKKIINYYNGLNP